MKKKILVFFLAIILIFSSCDNSTELEDNGDIYYVSVAVSYYGSEANVLLGCLFDQRELNKQLAFLSDHAGKDYYSWLLHQGNLTESNHLDGFWDYYLAIDGGEAKTITPNDFDSAIAIVESLKDYLSPRVKSNDIVILHYTGHGMNPNTDGIPTGSLLLPELESITTEELNSGKRSSITYLATDEFSALISDLNCKKIILNTSCYSGVIIPKENIPQNTWYITSSSESEISGTYRNSYKDDQGYYHYIDIDLLISKLLPILGYDLKTFTPGLPDTDVVNFQWLIEQIPTELSSSFTQHPQIAPKDKDLVLFDFSNK